MSDLDVLLDGREFARRALATINKEEFDLMNNAEKEKILIDIFEVRNKVLDYLGYGRKQDEKGIWHIIKNTPPEDKEIEDHEKWLDEYYQEQYDKYYKDKKD